MGCFADLAVANRPEQATRMALLASTETPSPGPVRDPVPCVAPGEDTHSVLGFLFRVHCQPGHPHLFHGVLADSFLVRTY